MIEKYLIPPVPCVCLFPIRPQHESREYREPDYCYNDTCHSHFHEQSVCGSSLYLVIVPFPKSVAVKLGSVLRSALTPHAQ